MLSNLADWFPIAAFALLLLLLTAPVATFCLRGWKHRKDNVLASFNEEAAKLYLEAFQPVTAKEISATTTATALLDKHYNKRFGRTRFIVPAMLGLIVAGVLLIPCALSLSAWIEKRDTGTGPFPLVVVLAIMGGYMWVLFDLIVKSLNELISPVDIYWGVFRFVISVPLGYAVGRGFAADLREPIAFCLGAFPTKGIFTILRRVFQKATGSTSKDDSQGGTELQSLPSVDLQLSETMQDEGITSIHHLANYDPVRLTIMTGLPFSYIVGVIGDAILWTYLGSKENFDSFRLCGINGAFDCSNLLTDLTSPSKPEFGADAKDVVKHLATALKVPEAGVRTLVWNVANDPNTQFIKAVW